MTKVMTFQPALRAVKMPAAPRLVMRWVEEPGGLACRWEAANADWFAPASARPLERRPKPVARRLALRLASRAPARVAA
ncbi:MAG: hypothetical protein SNJ79_08225 [Sphingomonadaceae bacterium]